MNENLAEICGIIAGDGHLSRYISKKRTDYKVCIYGDKIKDLEYFGEVQKLFNETLGITPKLILKKNCIELRIDSKRWLEFFEQIGIPCGSKSKIITIPENLKDDLLLSCSFLRGLADTDFCITFNQLKFKSSYPRIRIDLGSEPMIKDICKVLTLIGISYCGPYQRNRSRKGTPYVSYQMDIVGHNNFSMWMKWIGFRNPRHLSKIKINRKEEIIHPPFQSPPSQI